MKLDEFQKTLHAHVDTFGRVYRAFCQQRAGKNPDDEDKPYEQWLDYFVVQQDLLIKAGFGEIQGALDQALLRVKGEP